MKHFSVKHFILLSFLLLSTALSGTANNSSVGQRGNITIKVAHVEGAPKDSSIDVSINGHLLSIVFLENLGQVDIVVSYAAGGEETAGGKQIINFNFVEEFVQPTKLPNYYYHSVLNCILGTVTCTPLPND